MLRRLTIKNVVLIEQLSLELDSGLTVLTGETGAGKSILLDSLGLALGMRADASLVRAGADKAQVIAEIGLPPRVNGYDWLRTLLDENDIEHDGEVILKRTLSRDGRSRATINDSPVSITLLRQLGSRLIEVQGQFDAHGLLDPASHLGVLDSFGQLAPILEDVRARWHEVRTNRAALNEARKDHARAQQEESFLRETLEQLEALDPQPGEEDKLNERRSLLANVEKIRSAVGQVTALLADEDGVEQRLGQALRQLDGLPDSSRAVIEPTATALESALNAAETALNQLERIEIDADPAELTQVEDRLFALRDAARRNSVEVAALPELLDRTRALLEAVTGGSSSFKALEESTAKAEAAYCAVAKKLSDRRAGAALRLDAAVMAELAPLKLERARFTTLIEPHDESNWGAEGWDDVQFALAANPGQPAVAIHKGASGGELSRLLLALKVALASVNPLPSLVFDEVDSGVGGATADAVGERLKRLAEDVQIIVITHSPQVAARGQDHLRVAKNVENESVATTVTRLTSDERLEEIARMLSGATVTTEARAAAQTLLEAP